MFCIQDYLFLDKIILFLSFGIPKTQSTEIHDESRSLKAFFYNSFRSALLLLCLGTRRQPFLCHYISVEKLWFGIVKQTTVGFVFRIFFIFFLA